MQFLGSPGNHSHSTKDQGSRRRQRKKFALFLCMYSLFFLCMCTPLLVNPKFWMIACCCIRFFSIAKDVLKTRNFDVPLNSSQMHLLKSLLVIACEQTAGEVGRRVGAFRPSQEPPPPPLSLFFSFPIFLHFLSFCLIAHWRAYSSFLKIPFCYNIG